jgi:hypothetical protein
VCEAPDSGASEEVGAMAGATLRQKFLSGCLSRHARRGDRHDDFSPYPNVKRWLDTMRMLPTWPQVHEVFDGLVASNKDRNS